MRARPLRAVLFDWRGTLVHDPPDEWWVRVALGRAGREVADEVVTALSDALRRAAELPAVVAGEKDRDCSATRHREWSLMHFRLAGLDDELALSLYELDLDPIAHAFYVDATSTLHALHERGCRVAVVSDIHFDLRPEFAAAGLTECVDAFILSFEHGVQKPDPRVFELALDALHIDASDALMVGDRASRDGGAIAVGINTWLLPREQPRDAPRGLARLLSLTE